MIKRDITETVYEYNEHGELIKKTVTEKHEEDDNKITWSPYISPFTYTPTQQTEITCVHSSD